MSSRVALEPSFITFVLESSLRVLSTPESVNVFLERSNFSTFPWSELPAEAGSLAELALEPGLLLPVPIEEPELPGLGVLGVALVSELPLLLPVLGVALLSELPLLLPV